MLLSQEKAIIFFYSFILINRDMLISQPQKSVLAFIYLSKGAPFLNMSLVVRHELLNINWYLGVSVYLKQMSQAFIVHRFCFLRASDTSSLPILAFFLSSLCFPTTLLTADLPPNSASQEGLAQPFTLQYVRVALRYIRGHWPKCTLLSLYQVLLWPNHLFTCDLGNELMGQEEYQHMWQESLVTYF